MRSGHETQALFDTFFLCGERSHKKNASTTFIDGTTDGPVRKVPAKEKTKESRRVVR